MASSTRPVAGYVIALGSNRPGRHGRPTDEVRAALAVLADIGPVTASTIVASPPLGPSIRRFANAVAQVATDLDPPDLLARLKAIERRFGRRRGRHWGARVLDLDIVLWSGGSWSSGGSGGGSSAGLAIPHLSFRDRRFVLDPLAALTPDWRDPVSGFTVRQLAARLIARRPARSV